jgi:hypothetical protein
MKLKFDEGVLKLIPESPEDHAQFAAEFGTVSDSQERTGGREYRGAAFGYGVELMSDGSVEVSVREAWWNNDE